MTPKLYKMNLSPPVRAVLLCSKIANIDLDLIDMDLITGEQMTQDYLKLNPQHTVPLLDDDGFILADSHAIMQYLIETYAEDSPLLPKDIKSRATLNHRLHFDTGILFARGLAITKLIIFESVKEVPEKYIALLDEAIGIVEKFLTQNEWIAGDQMTIADLSCVTNVTTFSYFIPITEERFPKISAWIKRFEDVPHFKEINEGVNDYINVIEAAMNRD
ncbi:glutathione S-transferase 1-like isoform X1 [Diabrotica virgifera virgifera]|uniref:Glutathione S-transferase 1-like isoform X1 n=1 Tax=Diabrotica virgifera virgifera TaxID=50390 RepID=A0A6P7FV04_DIAVI|nr:glutathione S-transferase 1-like isoform X1 [Diabrotica virgifera virgifera]